MGARPTTECPIVFFCLVATSNIIMHSVIRMDAGSLCLLVLLVALCAKLPIAIIYSCHVCLVTDCRRLDFRSLVRVRSSSTYSSSYQTVGALFICRRCQRACALLPRFCTYITFRPSVISTSLTITGTITVRQALARHQSATNTIIDRTSHIT